MKPKRLISYKPLILSSLLFLSSCGNIKEKIITETKSTSMSPLSESSQVKEDKMKSLDDKIDLGMNLEEIASGNFSSIKGTWHEVAYGNNHVKGEDGTQYKLGGTTTLEISAEKIDSLGIEVVGTTLIDSNGEHELKYRLQDGTLMASLVDQMVAINWSVSFYTYWDNECF